MSFSFTRCCLSGLLLAACSALAACASNSTAEQSDYLHLGYEPSAEPSLSPGEVERILDQAENAARQQISLVRVNEAGVKQTTRMHIFVLDRTGDILGRRSMADAWVGSVSIAHAKAYSAIAFSSDQNALSTRSLWALSQPGGPLWNIGNSNQSSIPGLPGLILFPGGLPLYESGRLVGGIGVSGDGVDEDEKVALAGSIGFEAPQAIRVSTVTGDAVPFIK